MHERRKVKGESNTISNPHVQRLVVRYDIGPWRPNMHLQQFHVSAELRNMPKIRNLFISFSPASPSRRLYTTHLKPRNNNLLIVRTCYKSSKVSIATYDI